MELQFTRPGGKQKLTLALTRGAEMTNGRTTLACPLCESHRPDDYKVVGYGSQADSVREFHVLRCRVHGVEFADALPKPCVDSKEKPTLASCRTFAMIALVGVHERSSRCDLPCCKFRAIVRSR